MNYEILRKFLFSFEPETAHSLSLAALKWLQRCGFKLPQKQIPRSVMGLQFPNPVGLAAGLDKNGDYIDALAALGFGFIEIGTITPRPQPGNPKPRLFRLPQAHALINRMGFNNKGVDYLVAQVKKAKFSGILGINIGKNFDTPLEQAVDDYCFCLQRVYPYASYVVINISSPNTPGLRDLQFAAQLDELLVKLKQEQQQLAQQHNKLVPLVVKISPDLSDAEIETIADVLLRNKVEGVIATNTTLAREGVEGLEHATEQGGLSGKPVKDKSTRVIKKLSQHLQGKLPIIGVGGIESAADASEKLAAGASLVQIYTGFIYQGPGLIRQINSVVV